MKIFQLFLDIDICDIIHVYIYIYMYVYCDFQLSDSSHVLSSIRCTDISISPHLGPKRSRGGYRGIRGANRENQTVVAGPGKVSGCGQPIRWSTGKSWVFLRSLLV